MVGSRRRHGGQFATTTAVIVGSGYFPDIETLIPARAAGTQGGNALYLLNADGNADRQRRERHARRSPAAAADRLRQYRRRQQRTKNALQADPTAAGNNGSFVVNRAYLGDTDGKHWRFTLRRQAALRACHDGHEPADLRTSALLFVGSIDVYTFFATGSDLPPVITQWNRHLQALRSEGQLPVSGHRAVHLKPCRM
jgi:hypothetical protein